MIISKEQEDIYIDKIFSIFTECKNEQSADRRQVYFGQLCDQIFKWCNLKKIEDMGEEIYTVCIRLLKEESRANIPKKKIEFIKYLYKSLITEKNNYSRLHESGIIKIPKEKLFKLKKIKNILKMEESNLGKALTFNEQLQFLQKWFKFNKDDFQKYIDLLNMINVSSLSVFDDKPDKLNKSENAYYENDILDNGSLFSQNIYILCEAVKSVLDKRLRARDCFKALFTTYCIKNHSDISELEELSSVLDTEMIKAYKESNKKPTQYEIWQKYHPEAQKNGAEAQAAKNLKDFLDDFKTYLKEKNPEIFQ